MNRGWSIPGAMAFLLLFTMCEPQHRGADPSAEKIRTGNSVLGMEINPLGGAVTALWLREDSVNFLGWALEEDDMPENNREGAPFAGHFLCYGRWGAPSEGEMRKGMPHNGHHNNLIWEVETGEETVMRVSSVRDRVEIERRIRFSGEDPLFEVKESFSHDSDLGRLCNVVQHVTLGPPFLSARTLIFSNCRQGFLQEASLPDPQEHSYEWPMAKDVEGNAIDLRVFDTTHNYVSTHIFEDSTGWVLAWDPLSGSFTGYTWKIAEYPWINIWNQNRGGQPFAKGLEFGTTGIGLPYDELVEKHRSFYGRNSYFFFDAGETKTYTYQGFAGKTEGTLLGVKKIMTYPEGVEIIISKQGGIEEKIVYRY